MPEKTIYRVFPFLLGLSLLLFTVGMDVYKGEWAAPGSDTYMQMAKAEHLLKTGDWQSHIIPRSNPPEGEFLPWSLPVSMAFLALVKPLLLFLPELGQGRAFLLAALVYGFLANLALLAGVLLLCRRVGLSNLAQAVAAFMTFLAAPMVGYVATGTVDHHVPLAALGLLALVMAVDNKRPFLLGTLGALGIWLHPEFMVPFGLCLTPTLWAWLKRGSKHAHTFLQNALGTCALLLWAILFMERPLDWANVSHDLVSIIHPIFFTLAWVVACLLRRTPNWIFTHRFAVFCSLFFLAGGLFVALFPDALTPPLRSVKLPDIYPYWKRFSSEMLPLWHLAALHPPFFLLTGTAIAYGVGIHRGSWKGRLVLPAYGMILTLLVFLWAHRWVYHALPVLSVFYAFVLCDAPSRTGRSGQGKRLAVAALAFLFPLLLATDIQPAPGSVRARYHACLQNSLQLIQKNFSLVAGMPAKATLLTEPGVATRVLFYTPHNIVGWHTHRHRSPLITSKLVYDWSGAEKEARKALARHNTTHILYCPDMLRLNRPEKVPTNTFSQQLLEGRWPEWVRPVYNGEVAPQMPVLLEIHRP